MTVAATKKTKGKNHPQYVRLMELARSQDMTASKMAEAMGVSLQTLYNWSQAGKGISRPGLRTIAEKWGQDSAIYIEHGRVQERTPQPEKIHRLEAPDSASVHADGPGEFTLKRAGQDAYRVQMNCIVTREQAQALWQLMSPVK